MKCSDAAYKVLKDAGEPLHYKKITNRMRRKGLWQSTGRTPETTVNRDISEEIKNLGKNSRFCRVGSGMYAIASPAIMLLKSIRGKNCGLALKGTLVKWQSSGFHSATVIDVRPNLACVIAAWQKLAEDEREAILEIVKNSARVRKHAPF